MEKTNESVNEYATTGSHNEHRESSDASEIARVDNVLTQARGGHSLEDLPKHYFRSARFILSLISVALSYGAAFMGYVMVASSLNSINVAIGPSSSIVWVALIYTFTQTIIFTVNGRLSDIFGQRYFFIGGNLLSCTGFMISSRADTVPQVIGGSVLSGFGTGMQQSQPAIFGELIPNQYRYTALGALFAAMGPITAISTGLSGVMAAHASWRWVFYTGALISGLAATLQIAFFFPPTFDLLHTWKSAAVIAPLVIGVLGLGVFILWEGFSPVKVPLMPLHLFKSHNFVALSTISAVGAMIFYAMNIIYPHQITVVWQESAESTGWMASSIAGGAVLGQMLAAVVVAPLSRLIGFKWQLIIACVLFTAFIGGMADVRVDSKGRTLAFSLISSVMIGWMEVITIAGAPLMVEPKDIGIAIGVEFSTRGLLACLATSIYSTILANKIPEKLVQYLPPAAAGAGLSATEIPRLLQDIGAGNYADIATIPGITATIITAAGSAALKAYTESYQLVYLASLAFGGCSIIAALCINEKALSEKMTPEISRKLQYAGQEPPPNVVDQK